MTLSRVPMNRREFLERGVTSVAGVAAAIHPALQRDTCGGFQLRYGLAQTPSGDPFADFGRLERWGFDYGELSVAAVMALSDADFAAAAKTIASGRVRVEAMNSFIPGDLKVVGPSVDRPRLDAYVETSLRRAEALGVKVVVFGSGTARMVPAGFARADAQTQLREFLRRTGDEIVRRRYGIVIGIEAQRKAESNILNTSAEAYELAASVNHPKINVIVDFYHLMVENEDPSVVLRIKDRLVHLHFANPGPGRAYPREVSEYPGYAPFFRALKTIGYRGRISIEAVSNDIASDAPAALPALRALSAAACAGR
jgi:D-psicose/D-tagatose/L-ribulose 3-epimerase